MWRICHTLSVGSMTKQVSAGLLLWRSHPLQVLLVHPGGPFWAKKDEGAWSIPKGLIDDGEDGLTAAKREFAEEIGSAAPATLPFDLGQVQLKSGKVVMGWALEGTLDAGSITSNEFEMEWPPRSGKIVSFPEVDRAEWFSPEAAVRKLNSAQVPFVERLLEHLGSSGAAERA